MANSLVAQQLGKRYQAWLFWEQAAQLLIPGSHVAEVRFEDGLRAFDDIVVRYAAPHTAGWGDQIQFSSYQAKYHVSSGGAFSLAAMTDPSFVGAEGATFLSRLGEAYRVLGEDEFLRGLYWLVSPWPLDPGDKMLAALWRENTAGFSADVLRQGTQRNSQWVTLRAQWREATGAEDDEQLLAIISRLRLGHVAGGVGPRYAESLSNGLQLAGLRRIQSTAAVEPYSEIPWNLHAQGVTRYTKLDLERIVDENDLRITVPDQPDGPRLGIRTRVEWGDHMDNQCKAVLPLEDLFERRWLGSNATWSEVYERIESFLRAETRNQQRQLLEIAAPLSVAFAAGYALPTRDGRPVFPLQRRRGGIDVWDAETADPTHGGWKVHRTEDVPGAGADVAVGLGISREVWHEMHAYVTQELPSVGQLTELQPVGGPGMTAVNGAGHAVYLAGETEQYLRALRQKGARTAHLFLAAPHAFAYFLGQEGERLGRCHLYEFDFGNERGGSYWPSLVVPDHARANARVL